MKESITTQTLYGDKKILKMKRSTAGKQAAQAGPHLSKKHGIKQIQMVYLNPSHAGSRRSSSIKSNRSTSRQSEPRNSQRVLGRSSHGSLDHSVKQAYKQEGRTKSGIGTLRNKSISSH